MEYLTQHIQSLIFAADEPVTVKEIRDCMEATFETSFDEAEIREAIDGIREHFDQETFAFELVEIAGGFQLMTKAAYHTTVGTFLKQTTQRRLSRAALETLSIVAYKQPVTKSDMERIRGVNCDYSVQKLLEKELVSIVGRSEGPGRPLLYGTSDKFMDYFGLKSLNDMPTPKDFKEPEQEIGEKAPIDEE